MATPVQATAATAGAGGLALAGAYGITSLTKEDNPEEEAVDLSKEQMEIINEPTTVTFKLTGTTQELDQAYQGKVLQVTKKDHLNKIVKGTDASNEAWWDWAFKHKFSQKTENQVDALFGSVTKGYNKTTSSGDNQISLNQACEKAYTQDKAKYLFDSTSFLLQNISLFCTTGIKGFDISEPRVTVIGTAASSSPYNDKLANQGNNKNVLVKAKTESSDANNFNEYWWKWAHKNRFKESEKNSYHTSFQKATQGYAESATGNTNEKTTLNHACDEAYQKDKAGVTGANDKVLENVKKFCTLTGQDELTSFS